MYNNQSERNTLTKNSYFSSAAEKNIIRLLDHKLMRTGVFVSNQI